MEEEQLLDLSSEEQQAANRTEQRFRTLNAERAKLAADKEELAKAKEEAEAAKAAALKDVDFFKNFSAVGSKYPGATEYQEKIKEKVNAGYDLEDATISILAKEGKFVPQQPEVKKQSPAGGSAPNAIKAGGEKSLKEMSTSDLRAALMEAEARGDISLT